MKLARLGLNILLGLLATLFVYSIMHFTILLIWSIHTRNLQVLNFFHDVGLTFFFPGLGVGRTNLLLSWAMAAIIFATIMLSKAKLRIICLRLLNGDGKGESAARGKRK